MSDLKPTTPAEALRWMWWRICEQHNARKAEHADYFSEWYSFDSYAWNAMLDLGVLAEADRLEALERAQ